MGKMVGIWAHLMTRILKTRPATASPTLPMVVAKELRRTCKGVSSSLSSLIVAINLPHSVLIPTAVT